ncbi:MAG: hypothetical protein ACOCQG_00060 [Candidatus Nanoarchaeia archaeon]
MFTYILTLLIIGLMLYFGVDWIFTLLGYFGLITDTQLKTQLDDAFEEMEGNYGSMREYDFRVPQGLRTVCFLDKEEGEEAGSVEALNDMDDFCGDYPVICETWVDTSQNIAFEPPLDMRIEIRDVEIVDGDDVCNEKGICKNITDRMFSVSLVGKGDTVEVRE